MVHKLVPKKQKFSEQKQYVWTKVCYLLGKFAKHCASHPLLQLFLVEAYEVGIMSRPYRIYNSFRYISCLPMITLQRRSHTII